MQHSRKSLIKDDPFISSYFFIGIFVHPAGKEKTGGCGVVLVCVLLLSGELKAIPHVSVCVRDVKKHEIGSLSC